MITMTLFPTLSTNIPYVHHYNMNLHINEHYLPIACCVVAHLRLVRSCIVIQKTWRGRKDREQVEWRKRSIVRVQCCVRIWRAKRQLKILKVLYSI